MFARLATDKVVCRVSRVDQGKHTRYVMYQILLRVFTTWLWFCYHSAHIWTLKWLWCQQSLIMDAPSHIQIQSIESIPYLQFQLTTTKNQQKKYTTIHFSLWVADTPIQADTRSAVWLTTSLDSDIWLSGVKIATMKWRKHIETNGAKMNAFEMRSTAYARSLFSDIIINSHGTYTAESCNNCIHDSKFDGI